MTNMYNHDETNLKVARNLARAGIPVFPAEVKPQDGTTNWRKRPLITGWRHHATIDIDVIERWWQACPDALPAIELGGADLVVLDGDRHGGPDGVDALERVLGEGVPAHPVSLNGGRRRASHFSSTTRWRSAGQ